jgi:hypothetical protein
MATTEHNPDLFCNCLGISFKLFRANDRRVLDLWKQFARTNGDMCEDCRRWICFKLASKHFTNFQKYIMNFFIKKYQWNLQTRRKIIIKWPQKMIIKKKVCYICRNSDIPAEFNLLSSKPSLLKKIASLENLLKLSGAVE